MSNQSPSGQPPASAREALTFEEFTRQAETLGVPPEIQQELYPMVRDLKALARQINDLAPGLHEKIPVAALSGGTEVEK